MSKHFRLEYVESPVYGEDIEPMECDGLPSAERAEALASKLIGSFRVVPCECAKGEEIVREWR